MEKPHSAAPEKHSRLYYINKRRATVRRLKMLPGEPHLLIGKKIKTNYGETYEIVSATPFRPIPPNGVECFFELLLLDNVKWTKSEREKHRSGEIETTAILKRYQDDRVVFL